MDVLVEVAIVPGAPLLVPELSGPDTVDADEVRSAVIAAGRSLAAAATTWFAIGVDGPARRLSAYGVDVPVSLDATGDGAAAVPTSMLIAAWLRGVVAPDASITPVPVASDADPARALALGAAIAEQAAATPEPVGVLVVADGAIALTPGSPGGEQRESAVAVQRRLDEAVAAGSVGALRDLDPVACADEGVQGRAPLQVLAGLVGDDAVDAEPRYAGAPFGVGYTVATWRRATGAGE